MNIAITGALYMLSLSIVMLNSQWIEGAMDANVHLGTPIIMILAISPW